MKSIMGKIIGIFYSCCIVLTVVFGALALSEANKLEFGIGLALIGVGGCYAFAIASQVVTILILITWTSYKDVTYIHKTDIGCGFCITIFGWVFQILYTIVLFDLIKPPHNLPILLPSLIAIFSGLLVILGVLAFYFILKEEPPKEIKSAEIDPSD